MIPFRVVPVGDSVLVIELEGRIDVDINRHAVAIAESILAAMIDGVLDVVPTFRSVAVYFDLLKTNMDTLMRVLEVETARVAAARKRDGADVASSDPGDIVRVPVFYGGSFGPDLGEVASLASISEETVIKIHTTSIYRVFMLGFLPGFAYMGIVDPRLQFARRDTPRPRVPAGAVAIAGTQTAVYPVESPGGWRLIGQTPLKPYDPGRPEPFLFKPGDRVQFYPAHASDFGDAWRRG